MHLAGVSTRRIEDVGEILWGAGVSAGTVPNLNDKAFKAVEEWRCRPPGLRIPVRLRRRHLPEAKLGRLLRERGGDRCERGRIPRGRRLRRGLHGIQGAPADFPSCPKSRGLRGVRMFTGDKAAGMVGSIAEVFPGAKYQRCTVHFYRNVLAKVPNRSVRRSRPCSRPSTPWSRARPRRPRRGRWPPSSSR